MTMPWCKYLPPAPALPRALWLTGGALLLALLSYGFRAELWPGHPAAGGWSLALLPLLVVVGLLQLLGALGCWPATIAGPGWLRLLVRVGVVIVQVHVALLIGAVLLGSLIALAILS
ncbi:hypothetical protein ABIB44_002142 [Hymenobacter sp. UYCo722]